MGFVSGIDKRSKSPVSYAGIRGFESHSRYYCMSERFKVFGWNPDGCFFLSTLLIKETVLVKNLDGWLDDWIIEINEDLNIFPTVNIYWAEESDPYLFRGLAGGRVIDIHIPPRTSRKYIRWLYAHEARHIFQDKFGIDSLWKNKDREKLLKIFIKC